MHRPKPSNVKLRRFANQPLDPRCKSCEYELGGTDSPVPAKALRAFKVRLEVYEVLRAGIVIADTETAVNFAEIAIIGKADISGQKQLPSYQDSANQQWRRSLSQREQPCEGVFQNRTGASKDPVLP